MTYLKLWPKLLIIVNHILQPQKTVDGATKFPVGVGTSTSTANGTVAAKTTNGANAAEEEPAKVPDDIFSYFEKIDQEDEDELDTKCVSFEVIQDKIEDLQKKFDFYFQSFYYFKTVKLIVYLCNKIVDLNPF